MKGRQQGQVGAHNSGQVGGCKRTRNGGTAEQRVARRDGKPDEDLVEDAGLAYIGVPKPEEQFIGGRHE